MGGFAATGDSDSSAVEVEAATLALCRSRSDPFLTSVVTVPSEVQPSPPTSAK
jgi:hypothetical protein